MYESAYPNPALVILFERTEAEYEKGLFVWVIDQVWDQDGWILAKFFFCVLMDRDGVEFHKLAKKERDQ